MVNGSVATISGPAVTRDLSDLVRLVPIDNVISTGTPKKLRDGYSASVTVLVPPKGAGAYGRIRQVLARHPKGEPFFEFGGQLYSAREDLTAFVRVMEDLSRVTIGFEYRGKPEQGKAFFNDFVNALRNQLPQPIPHNIARQIGYHG